MENLEEKLIRLIEILADEEKLDISDCNLNGMAIDEKFRMFDKLLLKRDCLPIGSEFLKLQDEIMNFRQKSQQITDVSTLEFTKGVAIFWGDIVSLKADAIVNFYGELNDEVDELSVQSQIILAGGIQTKQDLVYQINRISSVEKNNIIVTGGHNLVTKSIINCKVNVASTTPSYSDKVGLSQQYKNCLQEALDRKYNFIVFSSLENKFNFPKVLSSKIAVSTVCAWLKKNKTPLKVVFCVLGDFDRKIYEENLLNET